MNVYLIGVLSALFVFFLVGMLAGRKVKDTNDYYVAGRNAPVPLIVGSLVASFLSTARSSGTPARCTAAFSWALSSWVCCRPAATFTARDCSGNSSAAAR